MKIKSLVSKLANHYFFVSNLSEWHKSCRKQYNSEWLLDNPLNNREVAALKRFVQIHQNYSFAKDSFYLGRAFYLLGDPWRELREKVSELDEIKEIFELFGERFDRIWENSFPNLQSHKKQIDDFFIQNRPKVTSISSDLLSFYNLNEPKIKEEILVILLLSSKDFIGGGANLKPEGVTLEVSGWEKDANKLLAVLFHELVHLCYENYSMIPEEYKPIDSRIRESIIAALFPNGYLGQKYFGLEPKAKYSELIKNYIDHSKKLDLKLLEKIKGPVPKN